jgi:hypothetical protein
VRSKFIVIVTIQLPLLAVCQMAGTSNGGKNTQIGRNAEQSKTINNITMKSDVMKELKRLEIQNHSGSLGEWAATLVPASRKADYGYCGENYDEMQAILRKLNRPLMPPLNQMYVVRAGTNIGMCKELPCEILRINNKPILTAIRMPHGIGLRATIDASDGKAIVAIDGSRVEVNQNEAGFRPYRPDIHSIQVRDQFNNEVLWLSLENPKFIRIRMDLRDKDGSYLKIDDDKMRVRPYGENSDICASSPMETMFTFNPPVVWVTDKQP